MGEKPSSRVEQVRRRSPVQFPASPTTSDVIEHTLKLREGYNTVVVLAVQAYGPSFHHLLKVLI